MSACIFICLSACMHEYVRTYAFLCIQAWWYVCMCVWMLRMCVCVCVWSVCSYIFMFLYVCVCVWMLLCVWEATMSGSSERRTNWSFLIKLTMLACLCVWSYVRCACSVCNYVCTYVSMFVYMYVNLLTSSYIICLRIHTGVFMYKLALKCTHISIVRAYTRIHANKYTHICRHRFVCIFTRAHICAWTHLCLYATHMFVSLYAFVYVICMRVHRAHAHAHAALLKIKVKRILRFSTYFRAWRPYLKPCVT